MQRIRAWMRFFSSRADMGDGKVMGVLVRMAIPAVAMTVFHTFFHLVDTVFVSWLGSLAMAAISFTFPLQIGVFAVLEGVGTGLSALVARYLGQGDMETARHTAKSGLLLGYIGTLLWAPMMIPAVSDAVFTYMGANNPEILRQAWLYNVWLAPTFFVMNFGYIVNSTFRCQGDTVTPLTAMLVANIINVSLDPLFIFTFGWGIGGAAFATFISRVFAAVYLYYRMRKRSEIQLPFIPMPSRSLIRYWWSILVIGVPLAVSTASVAIGMGGVNKILAGFGHQYVAAWLIGLRVEDLAFNTLLGIQSAIIPFLAFNYGRKNWARMERGVKDGILLSAVVMIGFGLVICAVPYPFVAMFRPDAELGRLTIRSIRIAVIAYPFTIVQQILNSLFVSTGYSIYGAACQMVRSLVLRIGAAAWLGGVYGVAGIWWFQPISWLGGSILSVAVAIPLIKYVKKKHLNITIE